MRAPRVGRKLRHVEDKLHIAAFGYLRRALPEEIVVFHVPNGGARSKSEASKLKAMGVLPGVADFLLIMPNGQVAFLELKRPSDRAAKQRAGRLSDEQIAFRARVTALGCGYAVAETPEQVEEIITRWLACYGLTPRAALVTQRRLPLA